MENITDLYSVDGWVCTWYDHTDEVIRVKWLNYTSRIHVRESCEAQLKAMQKYGANIIIADAGEAIGVPYPQDQEWFIQNLYPKAIELGLKVVISVLPKNVIALSGAKTWNDNGKLNGVNYIEVDSFKEAYDQFKEIRSKQV